MLLLLVSGDLANIQAQGPFQFAADLRVLEPLPGHPELFGGQGAFTLDGNTFRYRVQIAPAGPDPEGAVRGPGLEGSELFQLISIGCTTQIGTNLGVCVFLGSVELANSQIADL